MFTQNDVLRMFEGVTLHSIPRAKRKEYGTLTTPPRCVVCSKVAASFAAILFSNLDELLIKKLKNLKGKDTHDLFFLLCKEHTNAEGIQAVEDKMMIEAQGTVAH